MAIVNIIPPRLRILFSSALKRAFLAVLEQRSRWVLWLPLPLAFGICAYFGLPREPDGPWLALSVLAVALLGVRVRRGRWSMIGWLAVAMMALGFLASYTRTHTLDTVMLLHESGPVTIEGKVAEVDALPKALRVTITDARLAGGWLRRGDALPARVRVKLKNKDTADPVVGDLLRVRAVLLPLSAPVAPGAFDFQRHAYFQGLGATGYAIGDAQIVQHAEKGDAVIEGLRHAIRKRIYAGMRDPDIAAIVTTFLIGESKGISDKAWSDIRRAGIAHLLAISGFHVTVVTGAFFFLVRALLALWPWAALHWPIKKISAAAAMAASVFYLQLIGSPITAERSVITACVVMLAIMLDRDPFSLRLAAFAAGALLLVQPEALIGPSFQMSFAAVVALIAFYESVARAWVVAERDAGFLAKATVYMQACLLTTVIATLATAPFTIYHFGQVPLAAGLLTNLIAVPLSSVVTLPVGILACLLMPFHLEALPLWITEQSMVAIMRLVKVTAGWEHAVLMVNSFSAGWLALLTIGMLWICIWRGWWRWLGAAPVVIACIGALWLTPRPSVLVADNGRQMAVRDAQGRMWLEHPRREKFAATAWLQREEAAYGQQAAGDWTQAATQGVMTCDSKACLFPAGGATVSLVRMPEAVVEDCTRADVFIAPQARLSTALCPQKRKAMIDIDDLRYHGAHAVYVKDGRVRIERAGDARGVRPWTARWSFDRKADGDARQTDGKRKEEGRQ